MEAPTGRPDTPCLPVRVRGNTVRDALLTRPFEILFALFNIIIAATVIIGPITATSIYVLLVPTVVYLWVATAIMGGVILIGGLLVGSAMVERAGYVMLGCAAAVIAVNGAIAGLWHTRLSAMLIYTLFAGACFLRHRALGKRVKAGDTAAKAIARIESFRTNGD
jgi:hypothetical protein